MLTKIIVICLLFCPTAFSAVTELDAWVEGLDARTISAGSNRLILFHAVAEEDDGVFSLDSVKYGSVKLTKTAMEAVGEGSYWVRATIWFLKEADIPGGSNSFTAFWSEASIDNESYASAVYAGVDQTTPISDTAGRIDNSTFGTEDSITLDVTVGSYTTVSVAVSSASRTFTWNNATEELEYSLNKMSAATATNSEGSDGTNQINVTVSDTSTRGLMLGCTVAPDDSEPGSGWQGQVIPVSIQ